MTRKTVRRWLSLVLAALFMAALMPVGGGAASGSASELRILVAPSGTQVKSAGSDLRVVQTLEQAEAAIKGAKTASLKTVTIDIAAGTYENQQAKWDHMPNDVNIRISAERGAVFNGNNKGTFLEIDGTDSTATYEISGLTLNDYDVGISLVSVQGITETDYKITWDHITATLAQNEISGVSVPISLRFCSGIIGITRNTIRNVRHATNETYAAVTLRGTSQTCIYNNVFDNIKGDSTASDGSMHGVYIAHGSMSNNVYGNEFRNISGDPVRIRDASNGNLIFDNTFYNAGRKALCSIWRSSTEANSRSNRFSNNQCKRTGYGGSSIRLIGVYVAGTDSLINSGSIDAYLTESGNTYY